MSNNKKIFLITFALFIVGLNIALYTWVLSLKSEEVAFLKGLDVSKLAFDNQGRVWAFVVTRTPDGTGISELRVYDNGVPIHIYTEKDTPILENINIQDFIIDNTGRVWLTLDDDNSGAHRLLAMFDGKAWHTYHPSLKNWITALAVDTKGQAWIGVFNQGLYVFDGNIWKNYSIGNSDLINNTITGIVFDDQDRAWITSFDYHQTGGVNVFDGKNWQTFTPITSSLLSAHVNTIVFDKQNRAWIGTERGISVFDGTNWISYPINSEDLNRGVDSLAIDGQRRVWVNSTRVFNGKVWKYYFDPYHLGLGSTVADENGNIWSTFDNGAVIIRPNSPQPTSFMAGALGVAFTSGAFVYITILLLIVWMVVAFNAWRNLGISLASIPIYIFWLVMIASGNNLDRYDNYINVSGYFLFGNPAVFGTIGGIIGGTAEIVLRKYGHAHPKGWGIMGFLIGTALSLCIISLPLFFSQ